MKKRVTISLIFGSFPLVLMGYSTGPPPKRTGAAVDGGTTCTACHRTFALNPDTRGVLRIDVADYVPGVKQTIKVTVAHPEAVRWGFELTARLVSDPAQIAGRFTANDVVRVICDDGSARGSLAPCAAGQLEFAEHLDAPRTAAGAGFTFSVDWTPPGTAVGDIIFYAAGNAADGSGTNAGDRIYNTSRRISGPCTLTQKPTVRSAVNAASFGAPWNVGGLMTVFGANLSAAGQTRVVTAADIVSAKFPTQLACIAVTVNGLNAALTYTQADQINFQAPKLSGIGSASVVVIANPGASNELRSDAFTVTTQQQFAPAFFTFDGKSIAATTADGLSIITSTKPVKPGTIVTLYATGMGPTNPDSAPGDIATGAAPVTGQVAVKINGVTIPAADVLYAGLSPQSISGLQQINVRLPATLADGDVPVLISVGGTESPAGTTIPVKN